MVDLSNFVGLLGVPLINAVIVLIRKTTDIVPDRFVPLLAVVLGVALNLFLAGVLKFDYVVGGFTGLVTGLSAVGLYEFTQKARGA